jgi:hypothetical protein
MDKREKILRLIARYTISIHYTVDNLITDLDEVYKQEQALQLLQTDVSQQRELLLMAICEFTKRNTQTEIIEVDEWIKKRFDKQ